MKKICTVVGARPQFIKLAVVSREIRKYFNEIIIHTGQHYDYNMSDIFFEELDIPKPHYNLGVSGGSHGKMTGEMLIEIEKVLIMEKPDIMLLYGDTNSTLAGALSAVKLGIPVVHIEAGARLGTLTSPEEINRIMTDSISMYNLVCTQSGMDFLEKEGKLHTATLVGDPMYDAFLYYGTKNDGSELKNIIDFNDEKVELPENFYYLTCHRQENTDCEDKLFNILSAMNSLEYKTIYPVHPRSQKLVDEICKKHKFENLILTKPVGYLTSISLVNKSKKIITDSGGLQREAFFAKKQCVLILDFIVWPETMINNCNQLSKPIKEEILSKLNKKVDFTDNYNPFGDGKSALRICEILKEKFND
ncbi:MAG: UDP-N-acetylglucosamine 2-epimerase (non-hydrolyzing) [Clostridia bacterium]